MNVNSLDEVPDSAWFSNRIGARAMKIEELQAGAYEAAIGNGVAPGPLPVHLYDLGETRDVPMTQTLSGKVALVTGGSRGIGTGYIVPDAVRRADAERGEGATDSQPSPSWDLELKRVEERQ